MKRYLRTDIFRLKLPNQQGRQSLLALVMFFWITAPAGAVGFTADVRRSNTNQPNVNAEGRIMVGDEAIRTESVLNGDPMVVIYHIKNKHVFTILPNKRQFSSLSDGRLDLNLPPMPRDAKSPCRTDANTQCSLRGQEIFEGRQVEHWEISLKNKEKGGRMAHLWVDRELGVAVREQYEDGTLVEMRNLRVGQPDRQWFTVPADFQEIKVGKSGEY